MERIDSYPECGFSDGKVVCQEHGDHFCTVRANHAQDFFEEVLVHTKSIYARRPFILADWQRDDIIRLLFGLVAWSDDFDCYVRNFNVAWIELGRKNGKSELLAGIALYLLIADGEESAEIYGAAKDTKQARKVWDVAERMVKLSPTLARLVKDGRLVINKQEKRITYMPTGSYYEVITSDAAGELGHNPHGIIFDEVLTQPNRKLWDALKTGMGTRPQAMMVAATTAGDDPTGFYAAEHNYCVKIGKEVSPGFVHTPEPSEMDPRRFVYMRNLPKEYDPWDEQYWWIPNPALGDFLKLGVLQDEAMGAKLSPEKENAFRQFRLNQQVQQATRWLQIHLYDLCAADEWQRWESDDDLVDLKVPCYSGLDLSDTRDLSALCHLFPGSDGYVAALWRYWLPEARLSSLDERTAGMASVWVEQGFIELTSGNTIDYELIYQRFSQDAERFRILELGYDPWKSTEIVQKIADGGVTVAKVGQQATILHDPCMELERLIIEGKFLHNANPVTRWMADNVVLVRRGEYVKPSREDSGDKIDGIAAALNAVERMIRSDDEPEVNISFL